MMQAGAEWIFILIGIGFSIYNSIQKEKKAREAKMQKMAGKPTARNVADEIFARAGTRNLDKMRLEQELNTVRETRNYGQDVTAVQEVSVEDIQEDFTTRLNRKLMERGAQPVLRRSISEVFGDLTRTENERVVDYDDLPSYDERPTKYSSEHEARSHFKLNEGLRKDSFQVAKSSAFEAFTTAEPAPAKRSGPALKIDRESLKQFVVMHEVLGKPKALRPRGRGR